VFFRPIGALQNEGEPNKPYSVWVLVIHMGRKNDVGIFQILDYVFLKRSENLFH